MLSKQQIQQINKVLQRQIVQRFGLVAVALLVVGSVAFFGVRQNQSSSAADLGVLSISPASGSLVVGSNVSVTLYENSGTDSVNAVQTSLTYDSTKLQYVSIAESTAFPTQAATSTGTPGVVRLARGTLTGSEVTGTNAIATITFKVLGSSGTASLSYDPAFSYIVRSTDNANILTANTGSSFTLQLPAPTASAVTPTSGPTAGGTRITVTGTNFVSGASVSVGGSAATSVDVAGPTSLSATVPAHAAGLVNVVVTNPDGQSATRASAFTYIAPNPAITSVSPVTGSTDGGTTITITGTNFVTPTGVTVGGTAATSVTLVSSTQITAVTPAHAAGVGSVVVSFASVPSVTLANAFTFTVPAPTVSAVAPASGLIAGGTTITITGTNFVNVTGVTVGGTAASGVTTVSPTQITAVTPAHAAGVVSVVVNTASGSATRANAFTYAYPAPTVSAITPASGTSNGGTNLTITGTNFRAGATVTVGGTAATSVVVVNGSTITAKAPAHVAGKVDVVVTNTDAARGTLAQSFTYLALGDANNDGRINAIDLSILISHDGENYAPADFNGDGTVGSADLAILLGRWTW